MKWDDRQLRVGILGCGPIAQSAHFDACAKARNVELYAICDVADDLRGKMEATWEPKVTYGDYDRMLANPQVMLYLRNLDMHPKGWRRATGLMHEHGDTIFDLPPRM